MSVHLSFVFKIFIYLILSGLPSLLFATEINVPVRLKQDFLQQAIVEQVFTDKNLQARVWDDGKNCNNLTLSEPQLSLKDELVVTRTVATARIGKTLGNKCFSLISWNGFIDIVQQPVLERLDTVIFEIVDTKVYSDNGVSQGFVGTVWEWSKHYIKPRFSRLHINLAPLLNDLKNVLSMVFSNAGINVSEITDTVAINNVAIIDNKIELGISFDIPKDSPSIIQQQSVAALTDEELSHFTEAWQQWDAFLTFVIKSSASSTDQLDDRISLFDVLLAARHDIYNILISPSMDDTDPVPELFIKTWKQLAPELEKISETLPTKTAINYISFMSAADALVAIEALGETTGFTLTSDALRQMARIIAPGYPRDPVFYDLQVDEELRKLFGFGKPLVTVPLSSNESTSIHHIGLPYSLLLTFTASINFSPDAFKLLVDKLNNTIPTLKNIDFYLPLMKELLIHVADSIIMEKKLNQEFEKIYRDMILATAWQESCWRQFIKTRDGKKTISSSAGSIGIMQVNKHVWRGFYDIDLLFNDVGYNARAGGEILHHYFVDYAIKKGEHKKTGGLDNLPSSSYAMYNGGPSHIARYRKDNTTKLLRAIDNAFKDKYESIRSGNTLAVAECYSG